MKKLHPIHGLVEVLDDKPTQPGTTVVRLESGEKRHVTTEWLTDPPAATSTDAQKS